MDEEKSTALALLNRGNNLAIKIRVGYTASLDGYQKTPLIVVVLIYLAVLALGNLFALAARDRIGGDPFTIGYGSAVCVGFCACGRDNALLFQRVLDDRTGAPVRPQDILAADGRGVFSPAGL